MGLFSSFSAPVVKTKHLPELVGRLPSLAGKTIAITGTTSGTGNVCALECARKGATVLLLNRVSERSTKSLEDLKGQVPEATFEAIDCDLQDFSSVRDAAIAIKEKHESLDVLALNAGVMALTDISTKDGYDIQMQTNQLSHFLLTKELFPLLEKAAEERGEARVVAHSSIARFGKALEEKYFDKDMGGKLGGDGSSMLFGGGRWVRYQQTKLANATFVAALGSKLEAKGSKVKATLCHPGLSATNLQVATSKDGGMSTGFFSNLFMKASQSPQDGTLGLLSCVALEGVENRSFYGPGQGRGALTGPAKSLKLESFYDNDKQKDLLWTSCEKAVGSFQI